MNTIKKTLFLSFFLLAYCSSHGMENATQNNTSNLLQNATDIFANYNSLLVGIYPVYIAYCRFEHITTPPDTEHSLLIDEWDDYDFDNAQKNFKPTMQRILKKTGIDATKIRFQVGGDYALNSEAFSSHHFLGLSNHFFKLTHDQQEFIATHEAIHYKEQHVKKIGVVALLTPLAVTIGSFVCSQTAHFLIDSFAPDNKNLKIGKALADAFIFKNCATQAFIMKYCIQKFCYHIEKSADIGAAKALGDVQGGISLMHHWIEQRNNYIQKSSSRSTNNAKNNETATEKNITLHDIAEQQSKQLPWLTRIDNTMNNFYGFDAHPSHEERLKYLQKWQRENVSEKTGDL